MLRFRVCWIALTLTAACASPDTSAGDAAAATDAGTGGVDAAATDAGTGGDATARDDAFVLDGASVRCTATLPAEATFEVHVPSSAAPGLGVGVRVWVPSTPRYGDAAPIAIMLPGGHGPTGLNAAQLTSVSSRGVIVVMPILPGGDSMGLASGGEYDYRGVGCQEAVGAVVQWATEAARDTDGCTLSDRVPSALPDNVGLVGYSNGGNLAMTTLRSQAAVTGGVAWLVTWESPMGDQYMSTELQGPMGTPNPFYVPGTSDATTAPWPGFAKALDFDASASTAATLPAGRTTLSGGAFFVDDDGDGRLGATEYSMSTLAVPLREGSDALFGVISHEARVAIESQSARLFPGGTPAWLASVAEIDAYWAERDGSLAFAAVHGAHPDLLVIALGSARDHVQTTADHAHVRSTLIGWMESGHSFARLNPDRSYLDAVAPRPVVGAPDNDANIAVPYPEITGMLVPDSGDPAMVPAAVLEAADRTRASERAPNLDAVLF